MDDGRFDIRKIESANKDDGQIFYITSLKNTI